FILGPWSLVLGPWCGPIPSSDRPTTCPRGRPVLLHPPSHGPSALVNDYRSGWGRLARFARGAAGDWPSGLIGHALSASDVAQFGIWVPLIICLADAVSCSKRRSRCPAAGARNLPVRADPPSSQGPAAHAAATGIRFPLLSTGPAGPRADPHPAL